MNEEQLALLRQRITEGRQPQHRAEMNAHPRGWNDALDFVERTIREVLGEKDDKSLAT